MKIIVVVGLLVLAAVMAPQVLRSLRAERERALDRTKAELHRVAVASWAFHREYAKWPASMADLTNNPHGTVFLRVPEDGIIRDGWGNPVVYVPYDTTLAYGTALSYGVDGEPGGSDDARDMEERFGDQEYRLSNTQGLSGSVRPRSAAQPPRKELLKGKDRRAVRSLGSGR